MKNQKTLKDQNILKCQHCGCLGDESNMSYFEKGDFYIHTKCIEKIAEMNPIDLLLHAKSQYKGSYDDTYRSPRDDERLLKLLIMHYNKSKPLLRWDSINEDWEEVSK